MSPENRPQSFNIKDTHPGIVPVEQGGERPLPDARPIEDINTGEIEKILPETPYHGFESLPPTDQERATFDQARADRRDSHTTSETNEKKGKAKLIATIGGIATVAVAAAALFLAPKGESNHDENAPTSTQPIATATAHETTKAPMTWQEELAAALDARPKTGQHIEVGNRPVTAADAKSWLDADNTCLLSGAVKFSNQSNSNRFIVSLLSNGQDGRLNAMRQSLKTDENWTTCAGGLYASADTAAFNSSRDLNLNLIDNQMSGRTITRNPTEEPQVTIIDDNTVKVLVHGRLVTIQEDGKVLDDSRYTDGGTLKVQNGNLVWVAPY